MHTFACLCDSSVSTDMVFFHRPYSCDVSGDGGNTFTAATVTKNVPGFASLSLAKAQDFPLEVQMPAYVVDPS